MKIDKNVNCKRVIIRLNGVDYSIQDVCMISEEFIPKRVGAHRTFTLYLPNTIKPSEFRMTLRQKRRNGLKTRHLWKLTGNNSNYIPRFLSAVDALQVVW